MAENRYNFLLPDEQIEDKVKSNRYNFLAPDEPPIENKFNISNEIDNKSLYKNIELESNRYNFLLPEEDKPK